MGLAKAGESLGMGRMGLEKSAAMRGDARIPMDLGFLEGGSPKWLHNGDLMVI